MIETDYVTNIDPVNGMAEYFIPHSSASGNAGFVDIANLSTCELYEIKPNSQNGQTQGPIEVARYLLNANLYCPNTCTWQLGMSYSNVGSASTPRVLPFPGNKLKTISAWHQFPGVILYTVTSTTPLPNPIPVVLPDSVLKRIAKFIEDTVSSGADIDTAIRVFLDQNPDIAVKLRGYSVGIGVAIIVATLLADLATFGASVADDPASFYLAYRLITVAI